MAQRIPQLGTRWRWVVSFTPWPVYPQKKIITRERNLRLEEIIKSNSVQFSRCLLTCSLNSVSVIIKTTQEHKYKTQTTQIHKNGTLKHNKNNNMLKLR